MSPEKTALLYRQTRDPAHLVNLMTRHCNPLRRFVGRYATPAVANAVVAVTFRRFRQYLESGQPLRPVRAWLYQEARRKAAELR